MNCPHCQLPNPAAAVHCARCGAPLQGAAYVPMGDTVAAATAQKKGLAISALVLGILSGPLLCALGLGILTGLVGLVLGIVAIVKAAKAPREYGGQGMAIAGTVLCGLAVLVAPVMAAIAIPSLLRARVSANEAATIGDIRTIMSGQAAYQSANGGYYDTLDCLSVPTRCIPNYSATGPTFLDPALARATVKTGYQRKFHPGPSAPGTRDTGLTSPSSLESWAYTAVPATTGQTGVRSFCGDTSGIVCSRTDGLQPEVKDGACAPGCTPLQ